MDSKQKVTVKRLKLGEMYQSPRQRLWNEIRKSSQRFSTKDISLAAEINYSSTHSYITALKKAGIISEIERTPRRGKSRAIEMIYFKLDKDGGYTAPAVRKNGEIIEERSSSQAMWNTLRITKQAFSADELAKVASTDELVINSTSATQYLKALFQAGYLEITRKPTYRKNGQTKYRLLPNMNTGARPPSVRRALQVFDYNLSLIMYQDTPILEAERKYGAEMDGEFLA
ncbi:hypothetical protein [Acinetobacter sp. CFCC 10889]|uniref:hypothetical protein n=1 Tax=Acinetobacter sp. CFCC 10889 TaxID=1775557 RepID=UPI000DD031AC|nr:hypothetical protein [Acinetobacter sp. CFCC 10889]